MPAKKKASIKKTTAKIAKRKRTAVKQKKPASTDSIMKLGSLDFPVVGIGASAGGLEAMTELLRSLPDKIGMAFVLIQHLAPTYHSRMAELLSRETKLKVSEIKDGMKIEADNLYVIPPNTNLGILNGILHLMPRDSDKHHLPIDYFFQSLAKDQLDTAIGIILSGNASDGTQGLKAIKTEDGITFAQTPETAHYDGMPTSAISAGCVDFILNTENIARELVHLSQHPNILRADIAALKGEQVQINNELEKIFLLLRNRTGNDFTFYKHNTIRRRLGRRMLVHKLDRLKDYVRLLNTNPTEVDALFHDLLINVTGFFRDPEVFDALKNTVFPEIIEIRTDDNPIRIWVSGCSTGEEVYSIIITLLETLGDAAASTPIKVFASDIDEQAIDTARLGIYPKTIKANVSTRRLNRYFTKVTKGYQINKDIRDKCLFALQNIIKDPPFSHIDFASCRNMLIYMSSTLQRKILQRLHYGLNPAGFMLLGSSESIGGSSDLFYMTDKGKKIYKKKGGNPDRIRYGTETTNFSFSNPKTPIEKTQMTNIKPTDISRAAENIILNQYGPSGVVINQHLDAIRFIGHAGPYLDPAPGAASLNLIKLAHPDLIMQLRIATRDAIQEKKSTHIEGIRLRHGSITEYVSIDVVPIQEQVSTETFYLVLFQSTAQDEIDDTKVTTSKSTKKAASTKPDRIHELEQELDASKLYMQSTIETQESANEQLQSANEEIQSANEEMQSTNEELETAKEELQSTNEELITVNEELESRNTSLSVANNDMSNIIYSIELPLIMLNESLKVRYFSPQASSLLNLIDSDIGRPINNIRANVDMGDITDCASNVIETLIPYIAEVNDEQGNTFSMKIRPYRTDNNHITGVVIVFSDITNLKITNRTRRLATVVEDSNDAITVMGFDGSILAWNPRASDIYGYTEEQALNSNIDIIISKPHYQETLDMINSVRKGEFIAPFEALRTTSTHDTVKVIITLSLLKDQHGNPKAVATTERLLTD